MKGSPRKSFGGTSRPARVAEEVQRELSSILVRGLKDPRIVGLVTITGVKLSPDLREGVVYYSVFGTEAERTSTQEGLQAAAGFLRREIGHRLKLRVAPNLRFAFDTSIETGDRIEQLIREVHEHDADRDPEK
ncbi:MAG TPA: 30S ribosome-binding factor RbfA [Myxococcales bacterium]|nr:30S ribosome-binding factor RbfA [Myxococcales bacterium]